MSHKYSAGQSIYFKPQFGNNATRELCKIVRDRRDERLSYRIKSASESFERIADEHQLIRTDLWIGRSAWPIADVPMRCLNVRFRG